MTRSLIRKILGGLFFGFFLSLSTQAYAGDGNNVGLLLRGTAKTFLSAFQIPASILEDSSRIMFPFGIVTGTIKGGVKTVAGTLSGAVDIARGAAPYAKYALVAL